MLSVFASALCNSVVFTADDISVHHAAGVWSEWRIAAEKLHDIVDDRVSLPFNLMVLL